MELIIYLEPRNLKYKQSYTRPRQVRTLDLDNKYKLTMPRQVHDSERGAWIEIEIEIEVGTSQSHRAHKTEEP